MKPFLRTVVPEQYREIDGVAAGCETTFTRDLPFSETPQSVCNLYKSLVVRTLVQDLAYVAQVAELDDRNGEGFLSPE